MKAHPLLVAPLLLAGCGGGDEVPRPKNLLVLCVDTLRADFLGCYGADPSPTPRIDELAASSVVYDQAVSHASWTLPSFAAVMTSLYSSTNQCWNFDSQLGDSFRTLPEIFRSACFDTAGMASHVFFNEKYGLQQGFDEFDDELAKTRGMKGWEPITSPQISAKAVAWLDARARSGDEDPWLLWVHYFDPHLPYVPHGQASDDAPEIDRYKGEIAFTDENLGLVLDALVRDGFADDTAVVFLSDHGEAFEEHPGVKRHSKSLYREELRVPLMLRVPGVAPRRVPELVRTVDLLPTVLEVFGIRPDEQLPMEGVSLVPTLLGHSHESPPLLSEIRLRDGFHAQGVIEGRWKLIEDISNRVLHLFDIEADPLETQDLAAENPAVVERLRQRMNGLIEHSEELGRQFEPVGRVELSAEELDHLRDMGYVGDEEGQTPGPVRR